MSSLKVQAKVTYLSTSSTQIINELAHISSCARNKRDTVTFFSEKPSACSSCEHRTVLN